MVESSGPERQSLSAQQAAEPQEMSKPQVRAEALRSDLLERTRT